MSSPAITTATWREHWRWRMRVSGDMDVLSVRLWSWWSCDSHWSSGAVIVCEVWGYMYWLLHAWGTLTDFEEVPYPLQCSTTALQTLQSNADTALKCYQKNKIIAYTIDIRRFSWLTTGCCVHGDSPHIFILIQQNNRAIIHLDYYLIIQWQPVSMQRWDPWCCQGYQSCITALVERSPEKGKLALNSLTNHALRTSRPSQPDNNETK